MREERSSVVGAAILLHRYDLLCMTPLNLFQNDYRVSSVQHKGRVGGKHAEVVVESGCTRTLVHKRYRNRDSLTKSNITAEGVRLIIPLTWVKFESEHWRIGRGTG